MDEIALGVKQERGARAKELLDNELFKEAFEILRADYLQAWEATRLNDTNGRERLWQAVQLLGKIQDHFKRVFVDGKIASRDLAGIKRIKR